MVLHNNKWDKKAKRAVEKRKGISTKRPQQGAAAKDKLELDRPSTQQDDTTDEESDSSADSSFVFDSDEEGKTESERAIIRAEKAKIKPEPSRPIDSITGPVKTRSTTVQSKLTEGEGELAESSKPDRRFARRKLYDNASRYEEESDMYIQDLGTVHSDARKALTNTGLGNISDTEVVPVKLSTTTYTNPKEVELVPDDAPLNGSRARGPLPMSDRSHFDSLKHVQQKEEFARDMKMRFGLRRGFDHASHLTNSNDDEFFSETKDAGEASFSRLGLQDSRTTETTRRNIDVVDGSSTSQRRAGEDLLDELLGM